MSLSTILGWLAVACMIPVMLKGVPAKNKILRFLHNNHYLFGWLMLIVSTFHLLLMFGIILKHPLGLAAYILLVILNSLLFVKKKTRRSIKIHKMLALLVLGLVVLHVWLKV
ncbi:hypothetical protein [Enterococcus sp. AZ109]|uniref:hypothetical protein n=1 Tax=Enterococcus sp. AZ109 TaxID=2774634 RepID=UPI003F257E5A